MQNLGGLRLAVDAVNDGFRYSLNEGVVNEEPSPLLELPGPCLLAVLRLCADDPHSLFSAARAHSRLHQAALLAANSIRAVLKRQQEVHSILLYLANHGQHVSTINLEGVTYGSCVQVSLRQLPHNNLPALDSLELQQLLLQLQPGSVAEGVLWAGAPLKRLRLHDCRLLDGQEGLAAALSLLPRLQHLSISNLADHKLIFDFPSN